MKFSPPAAKPLVAPLSVGAPLAVWLLPDSRGGSAAGVAKLEPRTPRPQVGPRLIPDATDRRTSNDRRPVEILWSHFGGEIRSSP